ncbi:MAG: histidinol-phosphate transaminase [Bacteroidales bacterium]|jgi:histidinol-phosphate aminotransferase|nr:histidinol-phosphate transaminase [Bacteroidales bacterium]NLK81945.1 histidinol-phosphate transaminase [Bacteroidales bacterium]
MNTSFNLNALLRNNIRKIKPYATARDEYTGVALINLDANENPYGSIGNSKNNRYPDPHQITLKTLIAKMKNVSISQLFLGNGSDEAIDLLYRAFCNPGVDNVIICPPTYGMYEVSAATQDAECVKVDLTPEYELQPERILSAVNEHTKIIWLCSPNNPTGNLLQKNHIETLLCQFNGIVVIDEAYIDFADEPSWITRLDEFPNVVVLQTFSKAWGLANIRLGMMFASEAIISAITKIKLPYNINGMVQEFVYKTISENAADKDKMVKDILQQRDKLSQALMQIPTVQKVYKSDANFILAKIHDAHNLYMYLVEKGIIVRDRSSVKLCEHSLRITVGTEEENALLLKNITQYVKQ